MILKNVCRLLCYGVFAIAVAACRENGAGPVTVPGPLAGLRYVNAVSDTGGLDIRVVDIIGDAPATFGATFRSGGSPTGAGFQTSPPYQAVEAGTRRIRVFTSDTNAVIAQQMHLDTTFTFEANRNYTFFLTGFARAGQSPRLTALITVDDPPASLPAGKVAMRVVNLAPSLAGATPAPVDTTMPADAFARTGSAPPSGAPEAVNVAYRGASPYAVLDTARYRLALTPTGTGGPAFLLAPVVPGVPGSTPIAGAAVAGSVITAVIVPRSVAGSAAPQGGRPSAKATDTSTAEASRRVTRSNDTVTVQSGSLMMLVNRPDTTIQVGTPPRDTILKNRPDSAIGGTGTKAATGVAAGDIVLISGATEPEYNVWQVVTAVVDSLTCAPVNAGDTATKCAAPNAIATTRFRFRSRIAGTPTSPATGTPVYRVYTATTADYTIPSVMYLIDKRP